MRLLCRRTICALLISLLGVVASLHADEPAYPASAPLPSTATALAPAVRQAASQPAVVPAASAHEPVSLVSALTNPLFMAEYVATPTAHGIAGFTPGCPVRLVGVNEEAGKLTVSDGHFQVEVTFAQVTDDPKLAAALQRQTDREDLAAKRMREAGQLAQAQAAQKLTETRRRAEAAGYRLPPLHFGYTALGPGLDEPFYLDRNLFSHPYSLRGDPYTFKHEEISRTGTNTRPAANPLDQNRNYLGFY